MLPINICDLLLPFRRMLLHLIFNLGFAYSVFEKDLVSHLLGEYWKEKKDCVL